MGRWGQERTQSCPRPVFGTLEVSLSLFPRNGTDSRPREPGICYDQTLGGARLFVNLAEFTLLEGVGGGGACPSPAFQGGSAWADQPGC